MEDNDTMQMDVSTENITPKTFVFSEPNIIPSPSQAMTFGSTTENVVGTYESKKSMFTFAAPATVPQMQNHNESPMQFDTFGKQYKPKISRNTFKSPINVFTQALKNTTAFEQLRKNSRSQVVKVNVENSITCSKVPKSLLTKAAAKEYFTNFGQITKIAIRPKKHIITVFYSTKEEASVAYYKSGEYSGEKFNVQWTSEDMLTKSPTKKKESYKNLVTNLLKASDVELKSELEALQNLEYNLHNDGKSGNVPATLTLATKRNRTAFPKSVLKQDKLASRSENGTTKSEKLEPETQISATASIEELQNVIHQAAHTSEDKYKVLEARDKLMRLKQVKSHSLATAEVTSGTCPDMCPEKERLMRESQRQVAPYELLESSEYRINHMIAVKQYSRSSADQEEPMAHELRPVKSLKMTMSYLLHEIVDLCEQSGTNLAEWYHFLWDRTRGIRKDITQQELCCTESVELVEQCARFHIVCSERLCAEELSVFDKKINSENLTKCLQSLKYMYHDLRVKGIACKNEAEFRGYIILLNLNNANFMWDLQQLPTCVQKSEEVQFAIEVYFALESNNYCKFFNLVRKTTYLNACILLRYFNQVRMKALSILVKAYCRTMSTPYPLYELIDILGFEDENEAINFCDQVGLNVSNDELHILLNRQNFSLPVSIVEQGRACNMIESKRVSAKLSIGECIAGDSMPEKTYKNHKPHTSFDSQGYLTSRALNAEDQNKEKGTTKACVDEFTDKDMSKSSQKLLKSENNQSTISNIVPVLAEKQYTPAKTLTETNNMQSSVFKSVNTLASGPNTFPNKHENFVFTPKTKVQSVSDVKTETNTSSRGATMAPDHHPKNNFSFAMMQQKPGMIESKNTESSIFGGFAKNAPGITNPTTAFAKPTVSQGYDTTSPFLMTAHKSIFSGTVQGNIFTKPTTPSTIFNTSRFNTHVASQGSLPLTNDKGSLDKPKEPQDRSKQEELLKAQREAKLKVQKEKTREIEQRKSMEQIEKDAKNILEIMETEVIEDCCSTIVREEIDRITMYETISEKIFEEMLWEMSIDMCDNILSKELTNQKKLQEMTQRIKNRITLRCFNAWRRYACKRKRQRETLHNTPVWLQKYSIETCAKLFYCPEQDLVIQNMRQKKEKKSLMKSWQDRLAPIEVIIHAGIKENTRNLETTTCLISFWKLVISWPDLENKTALWRQKKIMNRYLCPENYTTEPIIKSYKPSVYETLNISIRHFEGLISDHNLTGSDALLFIAAGTEDVTTVSRRLNKAVSLRDKLMPIPVVFVSLGEGHLDGHNDAITSELETLLESGYISEYTIVCERNLTESTILNLTQSTILWLAVNKSSPNPLEMDYLENVYDTCLTEELWLRIIGDTAFNKKLSHALKDPNFVINLHNEAVMHLIDIILDPESLMYTKFPPEFRKLLKSKRTMPLSYEYFDDAWKQDEYRAKLESIMNSFMLPQWSAPWPITDTQEVHRNIMLYCQKVLSDSTTNTISCDILSKIYLTSGSLLVTNFIDILLCIVREKINLFYEDFKVVYNKNHIKHFRTLPWWFKSNVFARYVYVDDVDMKCFEDDDEPTVKKRRTINNEQSDYDQGTLVCESNPLAKFCEDTQNCVMQIHNTSKELESRLSAQQLQSQFLEEKIKCALLNEIDIT